MDHFYNKPAERYLEIRILTPMSFKSYGRYINHPDLRLIYQSLMNKYDSVLKEASMFDEDTLDMLVESDRDDIKSWLVQQYHYFMKLGSIDDFSKDTIEKRATHYFTEGGNSYIENLLKQIRKLPPS